jgi:hypothetical protein
MHFYLQCLGGIHLLTNHDLERLEDTYKRFLDKFDKDMKINLDDAFCWFIIFLLHFIKYCEDTKQNDHCRYANSIYNEFCDKLGYDDIVKELENCMEKDGYKIAKIQEILDLAKRYRIKHEAK